MFSHLDFHQFRQVLAGNLPLLVKIFRNDLIIPEFSTFCDNVTRLYKKLKDNFNGEVIMPYFCAKYNIQGVPIEKL